MTKLAVISYFLICFAYMSGCAEEKPEPDMPGQQIFVRRNENKVEIASKIYASKNNPGLKIRLLGVTHIGEPQYYQKIQNALDQSDTVLYESTDTEWKHSADLRCRQLVHLNHMDAVAQVLGLVNQKDALKYDDPKFHNIDYSLTEIFHQLDPKANCETLLKKVLSPIVETRPKLTIDQLLSLDEDSFKRIVSPRDLLGSRPITRQLLANGLMQLSLAPSIPAREVIVDGRDRKALQGIKEHLNDTGITTVLYGAGHMPGIEAGLIEMGYLPENEEWLTAFRI